MPRPIWKGQVSFGLVNIPVTLFSAEDTAGELHFKLLDSRNRAGVKYERINAETGEPVPWDSIVKGYEYEDGSYVLLNDEDFKKAAVEASQTVEILDFVDREDVPVRYFDKPYYLVPAKSGQKGYVLLREALRRTGKMGIAKVVIRTRQYLAALLPQGDALVLELLRFKHELREPDELDLPTGGLEEHKINDRELQMAEQLVAAMTAGWEPGKYHDEYRDALLKWIEHKARTGDVAPASTPAPELAPAGDIVNIMDLLKRSVQETARARRAPGREAEAVDEEAAVVDEDGESVGHPQRTRARAPAAGKRAPRRKRA